MKTRFAEIDLDGLMEIYHANLSRMSPAEGEAMWREIEERLGF